MADDQAEVICQRMAELRRELTGDVHEVSRNARVMTDWTFYVRRFPWAMVAIAGFAGFLLVPRKKAIISPDQRALTEMVSKKQLRLDVDHKNEKQGLLKTFMTLGVTYAMKTGMGYLGERMRTSAVNRAHESFRPASTDSAVNPMTH